MSKLRSDERDHRKPTSDHDLSKSFRLALDDGDSQASEEYSSSDEPFEDGTQAPPVGTFDDAFEQGFNTEEALAYAMAEAKQF